MNNGPYTLVKAPEAYPGKRYRGRYAYEHHVVWWKTHKRLLKPGHELHHLNGNHRDNRIQNLQEMTAQEHKRHHSLLKSQASRVQVTCGLCQVVFELKGSYYRTLIKKSRYKKIFCGRSCGAKHQALAARPDPHAILRTTISVHHHWQVWRGSSSREV